MKALPSLRFISVLCACVITTVFWMTYSWYSSGPHPTPSQFDTLYYYQYAQAITDGHPYQFTASQPPSTGSTSHLFPFVLSVLQRLGFSGERLPLGSFGFGVLCLGVSLFLLEKIERILFPESKGLGLLLCSCNGAFFFTMLGETDIVLFTPLVLGVFLCALQQRTLPLTLLLIAAAWTRPEGMVLAGLLFVCSLGFWVFTRKAAWVKPTLIAGAIGLFFACLVLVLNTALTGSPVFSSVSQKGHFGEGGFFLLGLKKTGMEVIAILRDYFLGLSGSGRGYTYFPILGMVLFIRGLSLRPWRMDRESLAEGTIWLAALAGIVLPALGTSSGLMMNRYFGWFLPLVLLYSSGALGALFQQEGKQPLASILVALLLVFQGFSLTYLLGEFAENNRLVAGKIRAAKEMGDLLPANSKVMANGLGILQYVLQDHTLYEFQGITNTDLEFTRFYPQNFELFQYRPEYRTDYWLMNKPDSTQSWLQDLKAETVYEEFTLEAKGDTFVLLKVEWEVLEGPTSPLSFSILEKVAGLELVDALDVGYVLHDREHDRKILSSRKGVSILPSVSTRTVEGSPVMDVGEVILGRERFTIETHPGQDVHVVLRTALSSSNATGFLDGSLEKKTYYLGTPLSLRLFADGTHVSDVRVNLTPEEAAFSEVHMLIPASFITSEQTTLTISGDHIAYAYWFYQ